MRAGNFITLQVQKIKRFFGETRLLEIVLNEIQDKRKSAPRKVAPMEILFKLMKSMEYFSISESRC